MEIQQDHGPGAGSRLPASVLALAGVSTTFAVLFSSMSVFQHIKNYRKPVLQRMVIRIMIMVPIYAVSSLIALFSLEAAFVIDAIRDIYEAFVIYCFFHLLLSYLGGERSLLILLHGRPPKTPVFPVNIFKREIDVSDPYTFLSLKRGILQYVQVKPVLAIVTLILKATGRYNEGDFRANSGYLYVSIVYNTSIFVALYCLAMFWVCVASDLQPFRPVPKFLCVKGILFFSFWQSIGVSILVAAGVIKKLGPYIDAEHISLGLTDTLVAVEMPFFAVAHMFAFAPTDFIDPKLQYVARMPMYYAFRDAFGLKDVLEDSRLTLRGDGMDYREFEPSEGHMHQGMGRERRIKAGLRYSKGGKAKYWLPKPAETDAVPGRVERGVNKAIERVASDQGEDFYAPLLEDEAEDVVHLAPDLEESGATWWQGDNDNEDIGFELPFGDLDPEDEKMFDDSKQFLFGDYNYPSIDISSEEARGKMWDEEERMLRNERGARRSPLRKGDNGKGYGATSSFPSPRQQPSDQTINGKGKGPERGDPERQRLIDHEQDRGSAEESTDVKLKWTNIKRKSPTSTSPTTTSRTRKWSDVSSQPSPGSKVRSPPSLDRSNSRNLPPDAVDLVVEDADAAEETRTHERRKGEPALGGPVLRKVYRRGFVISDPEHGVAEGEVEIDEEAGSDGEAVDVHMNKGRSRDPVEMDEEDKVLEEVEGTVARTQTPPAHARVYTDEENPWS